MAREAALARIQIIAARRTVLQIELIELQAEETQLRKFFRLQRTSVVVEASSYQLLSTHMKCINVTWVEVTSHHAPPSHYYHIAQALGAFTRPPPAPLPEQVGEPAPAVVELAPEQVGERAPGEVAGPPAEQEPLLALVPPAVAAVPAPGAAGRGRGRGSAAAPFCRGCRYEGTPSRGTHLWRPPCIRNDPPRAVRRRLEAAALVAADAVGRAQAAADAAALEDA